jgi:hypothetical protein
MWGRGEQHVDPRGGDEPPVPAGPMPRALILFSSSSSRGVPTVRIMGAQLAHGGFLESSAACSMVPPMPTPTITGGQGFGPALLTVSVTKSRDAFHSVPGGKHPDRAHVLAAEALGGDGERKPVPRYKLRVDYRGGVVLRVLRSKSGSDTTGFRDTRLR